MYNKLVIEFVGLPGIGKTSVMNYMTKKNHTKADNNSVKAINYKTLIKDRNASQKIGITISYSISNIKILKLLVKHIWFFGRKSLFQFRLVGSFLRLIRDLDTIKSNGDNEKLVILEEGFCQLLSAMVVPGNDRFNPSVNDRLLRYIIKRVNYFVFFTSDTVLSIKRISNRATNNSRFDNWRDCLNLEVNLERFKQILDNTIEKLEGFNAPVLLIDSSYTIEVKSQIIQSWIAKMEYSSQDKKKTAND